MFRNVLIQERVPALVRDVSLVALSSILIGLFGQIAIPLPFTPVPIATQPHLILLLAAFLGPNRTVAAVLLFLAQGMAGLPVFAGAVGGAFLLTGPTGGYLMGYLAAAFVTGHLIEKMKERTLWKIFGAMAAGNGVIFLMGATYLCTFVGVQKALLLGVLPFLLGDFFKLICCAKIFRSRAT